MTFCRSNPAAPATWRWAMRPTWRRPSRCSLASAAAPPALLLTGDADTTVKPRNSLALASAADGGRGVGEARLYPGIDHIGIVLALSKPFRGRAPVLADMSRFLRLHLRLSAAGAARCPAGQSR